MAKKNKPSAGRSVKVDFTNVKGGGGSARVPEGNYKVRIDKVLVTESQRDSTTMLVFDFKISEGKHKGKVIRDRIVLKENVLWRLRNLLVALGKKVPKKAINVNVDNIEGDELGITAVDGDEYKGRIKSEVAEYLSLDELEDSDDNEDENDDDDDDDDEQLEEVDLDEL